MQFTSIYVLANDCGGTMPWWFGFAALSLLVHRNRFINVNNTKDAKKGTR